MKQKLLNLWLLAVMMIVGSSGAWADNINATLDHTAGAQWGSNTGASTVDAAKEHYNNDASSAWAGCAYAKFSFTIPAGHTITNAVLTYNVSQGGNYGRDDIIYYMSKDFDLDWTTFAGQTGVDLRNSGSRAAKAVEAAPTGGKGERLNLSQDVTAAVLAINATGQSYIIFQWTGNAGGADLYGKASDKAPTLVITTTAAPTYSTTFSETNSVAATVKINNVDVTNGTNLPDGTYNFTATAAGYKDYAGSFTVSGAAQTVTFTMVAKETWNYTVNAICDGTVFGQVASGSGLEEDNVTVPYPTYVNVNGTLYEAPKTDDNKKQYNWTFALTSNNLVKELTYTNKNINNVVFYSEAEAIDGMTIITEGNTGVRSSNSSSAYAASDVVITSLTPGKYKLTTVLCDAAGKNPTGEEFSFKVGGTEVYKFAATAINWSQGASNEFDVQTTSDITVKGGRNKVGVDLIYIQRTGEAPMPGAFYTKAQLTGNVSDYVTAAVDGNKLTLTSRVDGLGFEKIKLNLTKGTAAANTGSVSNTVWTGNAKVVELTFDDINNLNSIIINNGTATELPAAATIAAFKATTAEALLTLSNAEVLEVNAEEEYTLVQDATGGLKLKGIVLDVAEGAKLSGTLAGIYADNAELISGTQTDYTSPKANGYASTPTEMTAAEAKTADNVYRLVTLKGVTISNDGTTVTATDKTGTITVDAGRLGLANGDVLASLTGVTYADGLLKATAAQSGLLWKADDLATGKALPVSLTAATYVDKLADIAMGDAITIETLGAGTIDVQNAAGQSIVKYELTQAENTLHFPVTADVVSDIQKHGLQLVGEGVNAVMAYKVPGLYSANMNKNTVWYTDDTFAANDVITLGAIHFTDVREGDKLDNIVLDAAAAGLQQDKPYKVVSVGGAIDFEKLAVRDDKAEAKEGEEFAQDDYQSTNGMVMSFGGLTAANAYSFKEAYPAVNKFNAVTEGLDQFPVDNNNKAYDPAQKNVPTKGTFYVFNPTKDGVIDVTIDLEKDKKLYVTEDGEALEDFNGITKVTNNMISFPVKAGKTYLVFANESNLTYYGFTFTPTDAAAQDLAKNIAIFKKLDNVKAKLMLNDAVVTYIKGDNVFVEDESGAIDFSETRMQFYVGQKLNGYIFGQNIKDLPLLLRTAETPNSKFTAEKGAALSKTVTIAEAQRLESLFRFVTLKNLKLAKDKMGFRILIDEAGDTIYVEDRFNVFYELPNKIKRIEGIIGFNNEGVHYIWPTSKDGVVPADEPATLETGKYYLKNVGCGLFWGAGNDWGTRGSLLKHAEYVTLLAQGNGVYKMETQVSNGGTAYYFEGDYMDNSNPMSLTICKTETDGVYTIASPEEKLFGYDGTSTVLGKDVAAGENAQWQILSEADMQATLNAAAADAPVDATFLILDPNFGRNNRNQSAWTVSEDCTNKNLSGGNNTNNCAESYMSVFTISQTIDVPNGKYVLNAQAAVTFHDNREIKEYDGNGYPQIFANDKVSNFNDMIVEDRLSNMGKLSEQFTAGMYAVEPIEVIVTDGKLTIGAKSERADIWAIWDNFELTYYGPANADGVLLQLDFENGEAADYWQKGVGYLVTPEFEGTTGQAASIKSGSDRGDYILTEANYAGVEDYNIDLDFAICKGSKTAFFAVMSESSWIFTYTWNNWGYFWKTTTTSDGQVHNPYLFELTIPSGTTAYINEQYDAQETGLANVNGGTWEFTEKNWYHLSLKVKADTKTVGYTVTDKATGAQALNGTYTMRDGESIYMKGIYERNNRVNADPGAILFDNIVVSTGNGPVTAIETVNAETTVRFAEGVYNLRGQKVGDSLQGLPKGLYIVNGKKVVVK